jgi:hypothetical protein
LWTFGFCEILEIPWLAENLSASQWLCSIQLVSLTYHENNGLFLLIFRRLVKSKGSCIGSNLELSLGNITLLYKRHTILNITQACSSNNSLQSISFQYLKYWN